MQACQSLKFKAFLIKFQEASIKFTDYSTQQPASSFGYTEKPV
jgi:hypothetical protein